MLVFRESSEKILETSPSALNKIGLIGTDGLFNWQGWDVEARPPTHEDVSEKYKVRVPSVVFDDA